MSDGDWQDPFAEDEAARERARRRAEREQRRRERQRKLADKVLDEEREAPPVATVPTAPTIPTAPTPPTVPTAPTPPAAPAEDAARPPTAEEPVLEAGTPPEPPDVPSEPPTRRRVRRTRPRGVGGPGRGGGSRPPTGVLWRRRALAFALLAAAFGLVIFGVVALADRLGGSSGSTAEEQEPAAVPTVSVTIPEGFDRRQIAAIAREAGLRGNYVKASRRAKGFNPRRFGADDPDSLEGFLFPATYELRRRAHVNALVQAQLDAFRERIGDVNMKPAERANLNEYDVLKIASMIEREVQVPRERRLVAAVIYNRLSAGTPLGIDATIRYEDQNFEEPLTESRLAEPTPYNTRINAGLPPTPIGNPGLASIKAAANPANADHFYYVVKPDTCGEHVFTASEQEFQEAVAEYQRRLAEEGGAPTPDDC
ncbi:MAG TPA: endolytic transglycosylase MltG [Solirubrobacterales bacterium]|nr:endolytic transglycosylase MltG [Solirubrobacterales bacterium]